MDRGDNDGKESTSSGKEQKIGVSSLLHVWQHNIYAVFSPGYSQHSGPYAFSAHSPLM